MKQLKESAPVAHSRIYALGAARGSNIVTNDEIAGPIDSSDEWIRQRTGVITRVRAPEDQSLMDLAVEASKEAIEASGIDPAEIGAVILATISFPYQTPSGASLLSELVGAHSAAAYDISAACAGYCYGIAQADAMVRSGLAKYVLVVGAEKLSDFLSPLPIAQLASCLVTGRERQSWAQVTTLESLRQFGEQTAQTGTRSE